MKINISYAEMSFLRDLVNKEKMSIWKGRWAGHMAKKDPTWEEINKLIEKVFRLPADGNCIITDEQCVGVLLEKFRKLEEDIQKTLRGVQGLIKENEWKILKK